MRISPIKYQLLLADAQNGTIKPNDAKRLFKALRKRFDNDELETFKEKLTLSAFLLYGHTLQDIKKNTEERTAFIQEELRKHRARFAACHSWLFR